MCAHQEPIEITSKIELWVTPACVKHLLEIYRDLENNLSMLFWDMVLGDANDVVFSVLFCFRVLQHLV